MKKMMTLLLCVFMLLAMRGAEAAMSAESGYVRLAINGTNVNIRPQPRAAGHVIAQMNDGDVFFAEKWPITCDDDSSQWYKIVLPAPDSGKIKPLCDWDSRFVANVAFVNANFVKISPPEKDDMDRILATPVGRGYSSDAATGAGEFDAMVKAGLIPFSPIYLVKERAEIFGENPSYSEALVVGHYERGGIRVTGMDSEGAYYTVMDPGFRKPAGFVKAGEISVKHYELSRGDNNFNWNGFDITCRLSVGANLPEIVRRWGEAEIERSAFEFINDLYTSYTLVEQPDFRVSFYEFLPQPDDPPNGALTIPYLQTLFIKRKGALIGGIHIGHDDEDSVKKLLGEPHNRDKNEGEDLWNWNAEFNDLWVTFDRNGLVSSVALQWRLAD